VAAHVEEIEGQPVRHEGNDAHGVAGQIVAGVKGVRAREGGLQIGACVGPD
jgi:hypothetical protein